jgi:hypothetical protein
VLIAIVAIADQDVRDRVVYLERPHESWRSVAEL